MEGVAVAVAIVDAVVRVVVDAVGDEARVAADAVVGEALSMSGSGPLVEEKGTRVGAAKEGNAPVAEGKDGRAKYRQMDTLMLA